MNCKSHDAINEFSALPNFYQTTFIQHMKR
jgi:hypothetical protein